MPDRALVVDDNLINLELMTFLLEADGFEVTGSTNAEEALQLLNTLTPDILLLDVQLPGMSGLELLRKIRARPEMRSMCTVIVTSYAMDSDRQRAFDAGCNAYITKPIDTRTFVDEVRRAKSSCGGSSRVSSQPGRASL